MDKTVLDFAMIASVIIGYFISISLITTSFYKSRANNYLAVSLFLFASITLLEWLDTTMPNVAWQILGNIRPDFLFAATLFTYFLLHIKHRFLNSHKYKWIYFPFVACIVLEIPIVLYSLYGSDLEILAFIIRDSASMVFNTFLIFFSRKLIKNTSMISEDKKRWLLRLNLFIMGIIGVWILTRVEVYLFNSLYSIHIFWISLSSFLWWVLYYGIFKLQVISQKEELHAYLLSKKKINPSKKNGLKQLKGISASELIEELCRVMEEEELYKDPLLSRSDLATRLGISEGYLSQTINQEMNKSTIQFVNEYRVKTAKNLLHDSSFDKYSVEAIGLESGFQSKSAFYTVFKSRTSMSPGAYRKLHRTS